MYTEETYKYIFYFLFFKFFSPFSLQTSDSLLKKKLSQLITERNGTEWGFWMFTIYRQQSLQIACLQNGSCVSFIFIWILKIRLHVWNVKFNNTMNAFIGIWNGYVGKEGFPSSAFSPEGGAPKSVELEGVPEPQENAQVQNLPLWKQLWFDFLNSFLFL